MSSALQQVLSEIEQLTPEEQLTVISHTTEQLKHRVKSDSPIWKAYQVSKNERKEVYRRLANS